MIIFIQIVFFIYLILEALHDFAVIELQNYQHPRYIEYSKEWHQFSSLQYAIIVLLVSYMCGWYWIALCLFLMRSSVFPIALNALRSKPLFYLGNKGFDGTMKKILGRFAGEVLFIGSIITIVFLNIYL